MASATPSSSFVLSTTYFAALLASFPAFPIATPAPAARRSRRPSPRLRTATTLERSTPRCANSVATPRALSFPLGNTSNMFGTACVTSARSPTIFSHAGRVASTAAADSATSNSFRTPLSSRGVAERYPRRAKQRLHVIPRRGHRLVVFSRELVQQRMRREGGALVSAKRGERQVRRRRPARNALRPSPVHLGEEVRHDVRGHLRLVQRLLRGRTRPDPAKDPRRLARDDSVGAVQSRGGGGSNRCWPCLSRGDEYQHPRRRRVANRVRGSWRDDAHSLFKSVPSRSSTRQSALAVRPSPPRRRAASTELASLSDPTSRDLAPERLDDTNPRDPPASLPRVNRPNSSSSHAAMRSASSSPVSWSRPARCRRPCTSNTRHSSSRPWPTSLACLFAVSTDRTQSPRTTTSAKDSEGKRGRPWARPCRAIRG